MDNMEQMKLWRKWIQIDILTKAFCFAMNSLEPDALEHLEIHAQYTGVWLF